MDGGATPTAASDRVRWRHNQDVRECVSCAKKFTAFLRRHHCRGCGDVFCAKCTPHNVLLPHRGYPDEKVRACRACASPQIINVSSIPTVGGEMLVSAHNIGDSVDGLLVEVEGVECTGLRLLTPGPPARIRCSVQSGVGKDKHLKITTAMGLSADVGFNYNMPEVQHCTRPPTSGGDIVVTGLNFGRASRDVEVLIGQDLDLILDGDATNSGEDGSSIGATGGSRAGAEAKAKRAETPPHHGINGGQPPRHRRRRSAALLEKVSLLRPHCALRCHVPSGVGKDIPIVVNVAGQRAEGHFSYAPPRIFSVNNVPADGGTLKITGANLGSVTDLDRITVKVMLDNSDGNGNGNGGGFGKDINSGSSIGAQASTEALQTQYFATNVRIGQAHTELVCQVPSPYHDKQQWRQASPTRRRRPSSAAIDLGWSARVVVIVAEQISPPEIFYYLAPPPPAPQTPSPMSNKPRQKSTNARKSSPVPKGSSPGSRNGSPGDALAMKRGGGGGGERGVFGENVILKSASSALPLLSASVNSMSFRRAPSGTMLVQGNHDGHAGHVQAQSEIAGLLVANGVNAANRGTVLAPSVSASSAIIGAEVTEQPLSWTPDTASDLCLLCGIEFTLFRRRHHCRLCGALVCGSCSGNTLPTTANSNSNEAGHLTPKASGSPTKRSVVGIMVRACDQCFTLRKLRSEQAAIISKSRLLMNLLPPDEGAEFRQTLVIALAEGARQCAERLCTRKAHSHGIWPGTGGNGSALPASPIPKLADAPRGGLASAVAGGGGGEGGEVRSGDWPGAVLAPSYRHHISQGSGVSPNSVIRPEAHPATLLDVRF